MAKKKELTLDESIDQALVPEEEWPYELPEGWKWVKLGGISEFIGGGTPRKNNKDFWNGEIPWASVKDIKGDFLFSTIDAITQEGLNQSSSNLCKPGDLIIVTRISPGKTIIAKRAIAINQDLKIVKLYVNAEYIHYYMKTIEEKIFHNAKGSTVKGIKLADLSDIKIPLPNNEKQRSTVKNLQEQFEKLDRAKELIQNAIDSFKDRKAAILHKAFTGELTKKWREENDNLIQKHIIINHDLPDNVNEYILLKPDCWKLIKLGELGVLQRGKSKHRPRNDERLFGDKYPFIQTGDVARADVFVIEHKSMLSDFGLVQSKLFETGTLCITIAANIGDVAILKYPCCFPDSVVGFTPDIKTSSKYIYYYMLVKGSKLSFTKFTYNI